jgi:hypothetical protein
MCSTPLIWKISGRSVCIDASYKGTKKGTVIIRAADGAHPSTGQREVPAKGGIVSAVNEDNLIVGWVRFISWILQGEIVDRMQLTTVLWQLLANGGSHDEWSASLVAGFARRGSGANEDLLDFEIEIIGVDNCCSMRPSIQRVVKAQWVFRFEWQIFTFEWLWAGYSKTFTMFQDVSLLQYIGVLRIHDMARWRELLATVSSVKGRSKEAKEKEANLQSSGLHKIRLNA